MAVCQQVSNAVATDDMQSVTCDICLSGGGHIGGPDARDEAAT